MPPPLVTASVSTRHQQQSDSMAKAKTRQPAAPLASKRTYLKQTDVPATSLDDALRVPQAIFDHYAGRSATPMQLAKALDVAPKGSQLAVLTGAAIAFGLIDGGAQAASVSATELAKRIIRPTDEGTDLVAKREAVLKPSEAYRDRRRPNSLNQATAAWA